MFEVIRTTEKHCEKHHIDYTETVTVFCGREVPTLCPTCQEELMEKQRIEEQQRQHQQFLENQKQSKINRLKRLTNSSEVPPRYLTRTFDNYKAATDQQVRVLSIMKEYGANFGKYQNTGAGIILAGRPGTGKTHLACALANQLIHEYELLPVFTTASKMIRRIRETYSRESKFTEQQVIDIYASADLLIIDEVGVQRGTESEEHLLFEVINDRNSGFKPTILISNLNAADIKSFIGERTMDRLREGGGKFIAFEWDSYRGSVANDSDLPTANGLHVQQAS
mgnify:CR=1 FL=1